MKRFLALMLGLVVLGASLVAINPPSRAFMILAAPAGGAGIALVGTPQAAHCSAPTSGATTASMNTTGANLLVVLISAYNTPAGNFITSFITDSVGGNSNSWNVLTGQSLGGDTGNAIFWSTPTYTGSGHTFSATTSVQYCTVAAMAFSGAAASSPFDVQNGNTVVCCNTTLQTNSITPGVNGELVVTGFSNGDGNYSVNDSITIPSGLNQNPNSGESIGGAFGYLIQATAAPINPTWSMTAYSGAATIAAFKP